MTIDLQQLKELALKASPGRWGYTHNFELKDSDEFYTVVGGYSNGQQETIVSKGAVSKENAHYIANASPAVTLDLIARIERTESEFKNFHRALCVRFGYVHDERDWKRDQVSLEEHIATRLERAGGGL